MTAGATQRINPETSEAEAIAATAAVAQPGRGDGSCNYGNICMGGFVSTEDAGQPPLKEQRPHAVGAAGCAHAAEEQAAVVAEPSLNLEARKKGAGNNNATFAIGDLRIQETTQAFLFFPDKAGLPCKYFTTAKGCHRGPECSFAHVETSLSRFLKYLGSAKDTLDIAVFNITCNEIVDCIFTLHQKHVVVRIVTDRDEAESLGSDVQRLLAAGVPVRKQRGGGLMHHKFAVVDKRLLLTGSFNWTRSAVLDNYENVLVTSDKAAIDAYHSAYHQLWDECRP